MNIILSKNYFFNFRINYLFIAILIISITLASFLALVAAVNLDLKAK